MGSAKRKKQAVSITLDMETLRALNEAAERLGIGRSAVVRWALRQYLEVKAVSRLRSQ